MANYSDVWDLLPSFGVVVSRLCPCLAFLFKSQLANLENETVSLMGLEQSADPNTEYVPSAAAEAWFQRIQASVYRGEPRRRLLAAGRSRLSRPFPSTSQLQTRSQTSASPAVKAGPVKPRAAPRLIRSGSSHESATEAQ